MNPLPHTSTEEPEVSTPTKKTCVYKDLDSWGFGYAQKDIAGPEITSMEVHEKRSKSSCDVNKSFGFKGQRMWVHHGCRATFKICYPAVSGELDRNQCGIHCLYIRKYSMIFSFWSLADWVRCLFTKLQKYVRDIGNTFCFGLLLISIIGCLTGSKFGIVLKKLTCIFTMYSLTFSEDVQEDEPVEGCDSK